MLSIYYANSAMVFEKTVLQLLSEDSSAQQVAQSMAIFEFFVHFPDRASQALLRNWNFLRDARADQLHSMENSGANWRLISVEKFRKLS